MAKNLENHNFLVKFDIYCLNSIYTILYIVGTQFYTIYGGAAHHQHGGHDFSIESFYALISVEWWEFPTMIFSMLYFQSWFFALML
jgi:hypothetical protein